jgi:hypothetical protein
MTMLTEIKDLLEVVNYLTVIGGVLWAVVQWPKSQRRREATEREHSYASLNDHFLRFLELQLRTPALGTNATDRQPLWDGLTKQEQDRQRLLFDYLASILERAFYFLRPGADEAPTWEAQEWKTWQHWIERYAANPNFVAFWNQARDGRDSMSYGPEFVAHVRRCIEGKAPG